MGGDGRAGCDRAPRSRARRRDRGRVARRHSRDDARRRAITRSRCTTAASSCSRLLCGAIVVVVVTLPGAAIAKMLRAPWLVASDCARTRSICGTGRCACSCRRVRSRRRGAVLRPARDLGGARRDLVPPDRAPVPGRRRRAALGEPRGGRCTTRRSPSCRRCSSSPSPRRWRCPPSDLAQAAAQADANTARARRRAAGRSLRRLHRARVRAQRGDALARARRHRRRRRPLGCGVVPDDHFSDGRVVPRPEGVRRMAGALGDGAAPRPARGARADDRRVGHPRSGDEPRSGPVRHAGLDEPRHQLVARRARRSSPPSGRTVHLFEVPCYGAGDENDPLPERSDPEAHRRAQRDLRAGGTRRFRTSRSCTGDRSCAPTDTGPRRCSGVRLWQPDNVHLTSGGGLLVWKWWLPQLRASR